MKPLAPIALLILAAACVNEQPATVSSAPATRTLEATPSQPSIEEVPSPSGANAAEPFLSATRDGVLLSWLEPVAGTERVALRVAKHLNGGWSAPQTIVERDDLFVNWADFPSVIEDRDGVLFAHWLQKSGSGKYSYDVRMAISTDGGTTWGESFLLNRDGKQSEHGFASLVPLPDGGIGATWLDGRNMTMGGHDGHEGGGDMTIRYATVGRDGTIRDDVELDGRTCECCSTGMAMTANGPFIVYRDRSAEEIRDISFVRREANGWSEPKPVREDGWKINGCPVNGPQADAIGNDVATAWFTAANGTSRVYLSFMNGEPIVVDDGKPQGRVDVVLLDANTAIVSWLEQTDGGAEIRARRISRDGTKQPSMTIAASGTARSTGFARIAKSGDDVWVAWTAPVDGGRSVRVARARGI